MGQLVYMFYSLLDVGTHQGVVLLGTTRSVDAENGKLELEVERKWEHTEDGVQVLYSDGDPGSVQVGTVATIAITPPVEWTDHHVSPIEHRLAQALSPHDVKVGERVLIVRDMTIDPIEASARNIEIVEMAFDPTRRAAYLQTATEARLIEDLACPHLQAMVREHFANTGGVPAAGVLADSDGDAQLSVLIHLFEGMEYPHRARFLADAVSYFTEAQRPWGRRLANVSKCVADMMHYAQEANDSATWKVLAALSNVLSPHDEAEAEAMGSIDFRLGRMCEYETSDLPLGPFSPLMASYVLFEYADTGTFPRDLKLRLDRMSAAEHEEFLACLSQAIEAEKKESRPRGRALNRSLFEVMHTAFEGHRSPAVQVQFDAIAELLGA